MDRTDPVRPEIAALAGQAARALASLQRQTEPAGTVGLRPVEPPDETVIRIPVAAMRLLVEILSHMANGRVVTVVPQHAELTTHQAARFLSVSRPHLITLLDAGKIRFRKVGSHRRIKMGDLVEYQKREEEEAERLFEELAAEAQKLKLGY
jgi:excisionase family DNA binding protein